MQLWRFITADADLGLPLVGEYSLPLVALSFVVASLAGYAGLEFAERLRGQALLGDGRRHLGWLAAGAAAMGSGVWAMHFIGMLAFRLPAAVHYDLAITLLSALPAVLAAGVALLILRQAEIRTSHLLAGGVSVAVGIGAMHYAGMEAMHVSGGLMAYEPFRFVLSIVVAAVLAVSTLYVKFVLGARHAWPKSLVRTVSAAVFGSAVCGMHYTAMTAARFFRIPDAAFDTPASHGATRMALLIGAATTLILVLALVAAAIGRRLDRASASVRELEARTRLVLRAVGEGIVGIDGDGSITFLNPAGAQMLGCEPDKITGSSLHAVVHDAHGDEGSAGSDDDEPCALCAVNDQLNRGRDQRFARQDGSRFPIAYTRTPIWAEGVVVGAVIVFRDITEELATEWTLIEAKDAADQGARAKSEFLANMSHEIRTPMNGVIGMAQILAGSKLTDDQRECVDALVVSGESLMTIINDILDFSKIEAGKLRISPHPFGLRRMLDDVVNLVRPLAEDKDLELCLAVDDEAPDGLLGDSHRLRQVLLNLASNAVKFTNDGRVDLEVNMLDTDDGHTRLRFAVRDTGIGIEPEAQRRLFQPFQQADSSTTRRFGGTGLGLAICRQLVTLMGGKISLDSRTGLGSTFWFHLTLERASEEEVGERAGRFSTIVDEASEANRGSRVLVAEDNRINQMVARRLLASLGCSIDIAANGEEALRKLSEHEYDIVFMDCYMPEVDGFQATQRHRQQEGDRRIPIIAMTASVLPADRDRCIEAGMDDYIAKPIDQGELAAIVSRWSGKNERRAA